MVVTWDPPTVAGIVVDKGACAPVSGTDFPLGESTVTCTADESALASACSFSVTITAPSLRFTKFMAFGDSITAGEVGANRALGAMARQFRGLLHAAGGRKIAGIPHVVQPLSAYPAQLQTLLTSTYRHQSFIVANEGRPGERAEQGVSRLNAALRSYQPEVLLLLQGIVDIDLAIVTRPKSDTTPIDVAPIVASLQSMVRNAQDRGVVVLLATLTPVIDDQDKSDALVALNAEIRRMAPQLGLGGVVDVHAALDGVPGVIGVDGLHPTVAGYRRMGEIVFADIVARYETTPSAQAFTTAPNSAMRRARR
jgi:lysophospholipase L1-like esterase